MQKSNYNDYVSTARLLCVAVVVFNNIAPILFDVDIKARYGPKPEQKLHEKVYWSKLEV